MAKKSACQEGDVGSKPRKRRSLGKGNGNPLEYSCLENFMDSERGRDKVHSVTKWDMT